MTAGPPHVLTVASGRPDALERALCSDAEWLWLLADAARPRDDALERLLAAAEPADAAPATILAGLVVDDRGEAFGDGLQAAPRIDTVAAIGLVRRHLLPISSAGFAHCLVARAAFHRHGLPHHGRYGPHAPAEWTARVLRTEPGYLVPASVAVLPAPAGPADRREALSHLFATARMLPTGTWTRGSAASALASALAGVLAGPRSARGAGPTGAPGRR